MRILIASVGRPRELADAIAGYETRAARYWSLDVREVREERATALAPGEVRQREGERLLKVVGDARLVACDERGLQLTSREFAAWLAGERERATPALGFIIGGAYGLSAVVRERASRLLALASWTLPHELARLVLAEQLYRAGTLLRGEPYHKE